MPYEAEVCDRKKVGWMEEDWVAFGKCVALLQVRMVKVTRAREKALTETEFYASAMIEMVIVTRRVRFDGAVISTRMSLGRLLSPDSLSKRGKMKPSRLTGMDNCEF
jgi:hypothetical protein